MHMHYITFLERGLQSTDRGYLRGSYSREPCLVALVGRGSHYVVLLSEYRWRFVLLLA